MGCVDLVLGTGRDWGGRFDGCSFSWGRQMASRTVRLHEVAAPLSSWAGYHGTTAYDRSQLYWPLTHRGPPTYTRRRVPFQLGHQRPTWPHNTVA